MSSPESADRRRALVVRELEVLRAARHPGVVEVLGIEEGPDGPTLKTASDDGIPLPRLCPLTVEEVAGTVAAVASTLADLHDLGLVHGALSPERILVRGDGRPVLCGFDHGGRVGETAPAAGDPPVPAPDPADDDESALHPAADVYALGVLLRDLADEAVQPSVASERHRPRPGGRPREALRAVADRAAAPDRHLRLSARALAAAVGHAVPGACLPRRSPAGVAWDPSATRAGQAAAPADAAPADDPLVALRRRDTDRAGTRPARRPGLVGAARLGGRRLAGAAAAAAVVVVAAVAGTVALGATSTTTPSPPTRTGPGPGAGTWPSSAGEGTYPPDGPPQVSTTSASRPRPVPTAPVDRSCPSVGAGLSADTDGDGCPEALRWAHGVLESDDERWAVGRSGDHVVTGDWHCTGSRTLAVLRPGTGEVFVFDAWTGAAGEVGAPALTVVDGGFALRPGDLDADGCPELLVDRSQGDAVEVPIEAETR